MNFTLSHTSVSKSSKQKIRAIHPETLFSNWEDLKVFGQDEGLQGICLVGLTYKLQAHNKEEALIRALQKAQFVLLSLRSRFNLDTKITRAAKVSCEDDVDVLASWIPRPTPFWRRVPGMPSQPSLLDDPQLIGLGDSSRRGALWHYSHAIAAWPEDQHLASSQAWQSLEAWTGNLAYTTYDENSFYPLIDAMVRDMITRVAVSVTNQSLNFKKHGVTPLTWYYLDKTKETAEDWLRKVLDQRNPYYYGTFRPRAFDSVFHETAGLLADCWDQKHWQPKRLWMYRRMKHDLAFLYGFRCSVVHHGATSPSLSFSAYLGSLGLEIVYLLLHNKIKLKPTKQE